MNAADDRGALVVGEALIDVVARPDGTRDQHPGGSPANVALGLGRLGRRVALATWLGFDAEGDLVRRHLAASGVQVLAGNRSATRTPVATAHLDEQGVATYDFDLEWDLADSWEDGPSDPLVVHTGSVAAVLEPGADRVRRLVDRYRGTATVTYDPNLRPALMGTPEAALPHVEAMVARADVVKVSDEDLGWLHPGIAPAEIAEDWCRRGPGLVVVTHGPDGAFATTASGARLHVPAPPVTVADTVGAGDSFMAGLLDGLWTVALLGAPRRAGLRDADPTLLQAVLERCARIAAITVSRAGANPPRRAELD